ncbi:hypothetical protein M3M33_17280, partial [Loigolactobacillus coryniformis]|uniref:hypothetical protein n=1 Tax=Loigolactobacillus coryniformis TaxID=1610 RepID=UPI00201B2EC5
REVAAAREIFNFKLNSLVTSIQSSQNQYLKEASTQVDEQKKTNDKLDTMIDQNRKLITSMAF